MARFKRLEILNKMAEQGMIPVYYSPDINRMKKILTACYAGGLRTFEYTNRGDFAHEVFSELNKWAAKELPEMILGVGSVMEAGTASLYMQLGAGFVVSPVLNKDVAKVCNRRKIAWMPGCGTATEISYAEELGAEVVKIFPGSAVGGPSFVSAVLGPSSWSSIMPTGGVAPTEENLSGWFKAGVFCVGMGSQLITKEIIDNEDYELLANKCQQALKLIEKLRS